MYGAQTLGVNGTVDAAAIAQHLEAITTDLVDDDLERTPTSETEQRQAEGDVSPEPPVVLAPEGLWDGHLLVLADGSFAEVQDGQQVPLEVPRTIRGELRHLVGLRDSARRLLSLEAATIQDTPQIAALREHLRIDYEQYLARFGPLNRAELRRRGSDPETGEVLYSRVIPKAAKIIIRDPFGPLVLSLEVFDEETGQAHPAGVLRERQIAQRVPVNGVETPQEALAVCLDTHGTVDLERIAGLLGIQQASARAELGELVYDDPVTGELVPAAQYLSGNVRVKLDQARQALATRAELAVNVTALQAAVPAPLGAEEVTARIGAGWINADTHQQFLRELLEDRDLRVEHGGGSTWGVRGSTYGMLARSEWGTDRMPAPQIAKALLEQRAIQVTDETEDGRRVLNPEASAAAQEKGTAMQERFAEWCWEQPERAARLLEEYNRRFNAIVLRDYTRDGERLTLPGLARSFVPRTHQRTAVARILNEPAVLLAHAVGAGKTASMAIGAVELKRLGMVRKPVIVVPNHMLEQFAREFLQLYPQARVLAAGSEELSKEHRRRFVARVASNDWDAVVMTRSAFERIPVSVEVEQRYHERELDKLRAFLTRAKADRNSLTVKRIEKAVLSMEQRLKKRLDTRQDPGVSFEETGIDYVIADEAHAYKNLLTLSNIPDAAIGGSNRAQDMHLKLEYLRERHGRRVVTFATATPIANSITEAHVVQRFLRPDLLADAGVETFDAWAATFARTVTQIEMAPQGAGNYRQKTRFASFDNVPEMLRMWHVAADVKTIEDLALPVPLLKQRANAEGKLERTPETTVINASRAAQDYFTALGDRAEKVHARAVDPTEDNMLKISTDGRKAALDMRLVTGEAVQEPCKLEIVANNVTAIWAQHRNLTYSDPETGVASPTPGALQLVFCDLGTPNEDRWDAYSELRSLLAAQGVPERQVRFIHEAGSDQEKARLFQACRAGQVAVLIGSTEKMGVGTNIQARAVALHHVDCAWRPADIEQREGRIIRQGNQNPEVRVIRYVVAGSFDAYMWQTVERKAKFIAQVMGGKLDVRQVEDIGDSTLSYAEVKALASGDPLILKREHANAEHTRLKRLERAHHRNREQLRYTITTQQHAVQQRGKELEQIDATLASYKDTRGERFAMTIHGTTYTERPAAAAALHDWLEHEAGRMVKPVGTLGAVQIDAMTRHDTATGIREGVLILHGVPGTQPAHAPLSQLNANPLGLIQQLEHRVNSLPELRQTTATRQQAAQQEAARAREALQRPFKYADQLDAAARRLAEINQQMTDRQDATAHEQHTQALNSDPSPSSNHSEISAPAAPAGPHPPAPARAELPSRRPVPPTARISRETAINTPSREQGRGQ
jgi:N12 class adenine-specific DNA methylase